MKKIPKFVNLAVQFPKVNFVVSAMQNEYRE